MGRTEKTYKTYSHVLNSFVRFLGKESLTERNALEHVNRFRTHCSRAGLGISTINGYMIILRQYFIYLFNEGIYKTNISSKIILAKNPQTKIEILDDEELTKLLEEEYGTFGKRDRALVWLLYGTGMRVSEMIKLNLKDISKGQNKITIVGKGQKVRLVFVLENVLYVLYEYLKDRTDTGTALFTNSRGRRLDVRTVQRILQAKGERLGLSKRVHPHMLRHQFATNLIKNGANVSAVQRMMGHESLISTQRYTHLSDKHLQDQFTTYFKI